MLADMNVWVRMGPPAVSVNVDVQMSAAKKFSQRIGPEHDQHQPNEELQGEAYSSTNFNVQQNDERTGNQKRNRMANSPKRSDK